ncbi:hypothetical protein Tco_1316870 [Tanacetum coccineum]
MRRGNNSAIRPPAKRARKNAEEDFNFEHSTTKERLPKSSSLGLAACASFVRAKTKCACCVRGFSSKSQPSIAFVLLWSQSQPLKILWEWCGIANMAFIQLGGSSRVVEMILARVSSGFAGKKYGKTSKLYLGFCWGGKDGFMGK